MLRTLLTHRPRNNQARGFIISVIELFSLKILFGFSFNLRIPCNLSIGRNKINLDPRVRWKA